MDVSVLFTTTFLVLPVLIISLHEKVLVQKKNLALFLYGIVYLLRKSTVWIVLIFKMMSKILQVRDKNYFHQNSVLPLTICTKIMQAPPPFVFVSAFLLQTVSAVVLSLVPGAALPAALAIFSALPPVASASVFLPPEPLLLSGRIRKKKRTK